MNETARERNEMDRVADHVALWTKILQTPKPYRTGMELRLRRHWQSLTADEQREVYALVDAS